MSPRLKRVFSLRSRITSTDLLWVVVSFFVSVIALGFLQSYLENGPLYEFSQNLTWPLVAFLVLTATKRCRDIDQNPWLGVFCVLIPLGLLYLLVAKETEGDNKYGANPRIKATAAKANQNSEQAMPPKSDRAGG